MAGAKKNEAKAKGKGKAADGGAEAEGSGAGKGKGKAGASGKQKAANSINVRHILVRPYLRSCRCVILFCECPRLLPNLLYAA